MSSCNGPQSIASIFPEAYRKELERYYSKMLSAESLIKYGYFDSLANKFINQSGAYKEEQYISNDQFYEGIFNLSEFYNWLDDGDRWKDLYFSPGNGKVKIRKEWTTPISFTIPKNLHTRREYKLINLFSYGNLAYYIEQEENTISNIFLQNKNSTSKFFSSEAFKFAITQDLRNTLLSGKNKRYITDVQNFYHSIYTHSIEWMLEGKDNAKRNIGVNDWKNYTFGKSLDKLIQNSQSGETHGLPTGNLITRIIAEVYMCKFDEILLDINKGYSFSRFVDDIVFAFNADMELLDFKKSLNEKIREYSLSLNDSKTKIESFPFEGNKNKDAIFTFFDTLPEMPKEADDSIKNLGKRRVKDKISQFIDYCVSEEERGNRGSLKCIPAVLANSIRPLPIGNSYHLQPIVKALGDDYRKYLVDIFFEPHYLTGMSLFERILDLSFMDSTITQKIIDFSQILVRDITFGKLPWGRTFIINKVEKAAEIYFDRIKDTLKGKIEEYIDSGSNQEIYSYLLMIIIFNYDKKMDSNSVNAICKSVIQSQIDDINMILATIIYYRKNGNYDGIAEVMAKALWDAHYPVCLKKEDLDPDSWYKKPCDCGDEFSDQLWMYRYYLYFMYKNNSSYVDGKGRKQKRRTYPDFRNSIKNVRIDGQDVDLRNHFDFRKSPNLSEVNKFYKAMLDNGVKIIDDGGGKFIYSLL
ncbi:RNA-directed DNA polymerase [Rothia sp. (in: high G+C Gram-positive bacteria)]|uniref:RNA-directed DNA polymerase n=1 Tax=Rothia sp. (in: high G+C Gram-positive bacteria) TaxID=1885016 RepID=UPI001CB1D922|nr:RNA-directed DNA polymerase [Rothia sp. (in: high G+C Gram-positive bacteria)]MBF1655857.1 RNA-directed DNA polymerase [Rothia sp. (in: high G+C Gram-positive bacteria)]